MAVSSVDTLSGPYTTNGVTTTFPFTFKAMAESEVRVFRIASTGIETTISSGAYDVTLDDDGGSVVFTEAPADGDPLYIGTDPDFTQQITFENQGAFLPEVMNEAFDRAATRDLAIKNDVDRAPKIPLNGGVESQFPVVLPDGSWGFSRGTGADAGLRTDLAGPDGAALSGFRPDGSGAVDTAVQAKLRRFISLSEYGSATQATAAAYANDALLWLKRGEVAKLVCNPTAGDNLQTMCQWAAGAHFIEEGASLYVEIADGLHDVTTYVDITDKRLLDVRATATPDQLIVTSATFSGVSGVVTVTINVDPSTPLPARVVAGFAVGGMNIQGDGGADMLNTGMIVKARNSSTQFTADIRSSGTSLAAFTTPDNTASLGLTPNRLIVPFCTIRCAEAGWDGAAREAFMNALTGGRIHLTYVGIAYNGITGDNDILFARDAGSEIYLKDYCVIAGSGEMITRAFNQGNIITNRSCLGGGSTGVNVFQGSGGGKASFTRTMMGSVSGDAISASSGCNVQMGNCVLAGANQGLRSVNPDASIIATSTRVSRCTNGAVPTNGNVSIDANSSIKNCTSSIIVTGSAQGKVYGAPTTASNTNADPTPLQISSSGGVWMQSAGLPVDATFFKVGVASGALDFPSIAANSYADLTLALTGAALGDFCVVTRSGAWPAQGIQYSAFVSASGTVTVRAYNVTTGAIDPTSATYKVLVMRAS